MYINIHAGHNPAGMIGCGAVGIIDESFENRIVKERMLYYLRSLGHVVYDCTCNNGASQNDVLNKIVANCNSHYADLDVSIHFNSGRNDYSGDGSIGGVECWVYPNGGANDVASAICESVAALGFRNRGVKTSKDLFVLRKTKAPAILVECCFVDDRDDCNLYDADKMAKAIVKGIDVREMVPIQEPQINCSQDNSFLIQVKTNLNIRKGPGIEYSVTGVIKDRVKYTIVETAKVADGGTWGKLKSGAGWINIGKAYCDIVN